MSISHHLDDATLMSFAAAALPAALAVVAAAHIAMCPRCRREIAPLERIGAALVGDLAPAPLDRPEPAPPPQRGARGNVRIAPLARLIGDDLDGIKWRWIGPGVWQCPLPLTGDGTLNLIKAGPGRAVPEHGHAGSELTLVLRGTLRDETGVYGRGDVADLDEEVAHQPRAGDDGECICLVASEKQAQFHGWLARLMRPWHGM